MNRDRVVVTGLGAITPVGKNVPDYWNSLKSGKSGVGLIDVFDTAEYNSKVAAQIRDFDSSSFIPPKEARRMDRYTQFAVMATKEAIDDAGIEIDKMNPNRIGTLVGTGIGGLSTIEDQHTRLMEKGPRRISPFFIPMSIVNMASGIVSIFFGAKGPNICIATACAASTHAIGEGARIIRDGDADIMIVGGSEAAITPFGIGGFCALNALSKWEENPAEASRPFDAKRCGFVMGEGAGILILESLASAQKRGAKIYCEIAGYGLSSDAYHMTAPHFEGEGGARSMQMAIDKAEINPSDIDYINAHGTSTLLNDKLETLAIRNVFKEDANNLMVSSTKSMTGHLIGAAGAVEMIASIMAIGEGVVPPTINYKYPDPDCDLDYVPNEAREFPVKYVLSNSLGFGGHNCTVIAKKFD